MHTNNVTLVASHRSSSPLLLASLLAIPRRYERTPNQDMSIGLQPSAAAIEQGKIDDNDKSHKNPMNSKNTESTSEVRRREGSEESSARLLT